MIDIDVQSRTPIYRQICDQIETLALNGVLLPNQQLISVRQLAKNFGINPNTITKAYSELEQSGIIYSVPGKGSFISPDLEGATAKKRRELLLKVFNTARQAKDLGVPRVDTVSAVSDAYDTDSEVVK